jgi:hypothetical protein
MMADAEYERGSTPRPDPTVLTTDQLIREIAHLKELMGLHFELIEEQRVESKIDNAKALDAALLAAKESVNSLAATYEVGHTTLIAALDETKNRLTTLEARELGKNQVTSTTLAKRDDMRGTIALVVAGASVLLTLIITIVNEVVVHMGH